MPPPIHNEIVEHLLRLLDEGRTVTKIRRKYAPVLFETDQGDSTLDLSARNPYVRQGWWNVLVKLAQQAKGMRLEG